MTPREKQSLIDDYYRNGQNEEKVFHSPLSFAMDLAGHSLRNLAEIKNMRRKINVNVENETDDWNNVSTEVQGLGDSNLDL